MISLFNMPKDLMNLILPYFEFKTLLMLRSVDKRLRSFAEVILTNLIFPNKEFKNKFSKVIDSEDALIAAIKDAVSNLKGDRNTCFRFYYIQCEAKPAVELAISYVQENLNAKIYTYLISNSVIPSCSCIVTKSENDLPGYKLVYFNSKNIAPYTEIIENLKLEFLSKNERIDKALQDENSYDYIEEKMPLAFKPLLDQELHIFRSANYWKVISMLKKISSSESVYLIYNERTRIHNSTEFLHI